MNNQGCSDVVSFETMVPAGLCVPTILWALLAYRDLVAKRKWRTLHSMMDNRVTKFGKLQMLQ